MRDIVIALIAASPGLAAALVSWSTSRRTKALAETTEGVRATAERVRNQVENSHVENLRDSLDERHDEIVTALREVKRDVGGLRSDVRTLHRSDQQLDERMQRVESHLIRTQKEQT